VGPARVGGRREKNQGGGGAEALLNNIWVRREKETKERASCGGGKLGGGKRGTQGVRLSLKVSTRKKRGATERLSNWARKGCGGG